MSKKHVSKVLLAGLLAVPLFALAHGAGGIERQGCAGGMHQGGRHAGHGMAGEGRHGGGPGMGGLRGLDLSQQQQDQVFALMHGQMPVQRAKAQELRQAMDELRQLSAAERFDADKARVLTERIGKLQAERALLRSEMKAKVRELLTPEQRRRLDERADRRLGRAHEAHAGSQRHS